MQGWMETRRNGRGRESVSGAAVSGRRASPRACARKSSRAQRNVRALKLKHRAANTAVHRVHQELAHPGSRKEVAQLSLGLRAVEPGAAAQLEEAH